MGTLETVNVNVGREYSILDLEGDTLRIGLTDTQVEEIIKQYKVYTKPTPRPSGRPPQLIDWQVVRTMRANDFSWRATAKALGLSHMTLTRQVKRRIEMRGKI